jgi:MoaA/NifB/PqqE/SkfB family radical SAM enzyme
MTSASELLQTTPMASPVRRRPLNFLIMFVTRRCNAKCHTCFYADSLNDGSPELTLENYQAIADKAGPFNNLLFSGGEPSLRADLDQIAEIFHKTCGIVHVAMPTNGLLTERIVKLAEGILTRCPTLRLDVNLSLDGLAETHNRIRGVPGNFKKSEETLQALIALRERNPQLRVHVETVICNQNVDEIPGLIDYMRSHFDLNGHFAEVIRGTPPNPALAPPPHDTLKAMHALIMDNHRQYMARQRGPLASELKIINEIYTRQRHWLREGNWPAPCVAGERIAVIEPTAEVRLCELKPIIGNLRDFDWDLHALLDAQAARELRTWIIEHKCSCTHCVFVSESMHAAGRFEPTLANRTRRVLESVFSNT